MRILLALALLAVLATACDNDSPTTPATLPFDTLAKASSSGFDRAERLAIHSPQAWRQAWETLHARGGSAPALPSVDFGGDTVFLAAAGERPDGCYTLDVTAANLTGSGVVELEVTETVFTTNCICTQAVTQPVHAVRVARPGAAATFVERTVRKSC